MGWDSDYIGVYSIFKLPFEVNILSHMPKLGKNERYYHSDDDKTYTLLIYGCLKSIGLLNKATSLLFLRNFFSL